jgi:putative hydrolase of the HAD superfamily
MKGQEAFTALAQRFPALHLALDEVTYQPTGAISFTEQRRHRIRAVFPAPLEDHEADRLFSIYLVYYEQSWSAFPDVLPCLDRLTAHTLRILSNGNTQQQRKKLEILGICVYVGDRLETDARAAYQAGWTDIWLNRTASERVPSDVIAIPALGALPRVIAPAGADSGLFVAPDPQQ